MTALNTEIDALAQRIGMLGEEGLVDEAAVLVAKLDELKREKDALSRVRREFHCPCAHTDSALDGRGGEADRTREEPDRVRHVRLCHPARLEQC